MKNKKDLVLSDCVAREIRRKKEKTGYMSIICEGLMLGNSGFAKAMRNIAYGLSTTEEVKAIVLDGDDCGVGETEIGKKIIDCSRRTDIGDDSCFYISMNIPLGIGRHLGHYNIPYIMFETLDFPSAFVNHLRSIKVDEIWTPSNFCRNSMIRAGLGNIGNGTNGNKIKVIPLGVDTKMFSPENADEPRYIYGNLSDMKNKFKFLSVMGYSERKGVGTLIRAYIEEFDRCDDVVLFLKGGWYPESVAAHEIRGMMTGISHPPQVHLDFRTYPDEVMASLYKACDCYVLPSKGEGWGLTYVEAMSMGMPVIATNSGAQIDFMDESNSYLIDVERYDTEPTCEWITPFYKDQKFAHPSKDHLRKLMRHVYENRDEAREKGKQARKYIVENFDWKISCGKMRDRLLEIINAE